MQIIDNVAETLKELTIHALEEIGDVDVITSVTLEEVVGTVSLKLIFRMEPYQEGDISVKHELYTFVDEISSVIITPSLRKSYTSREKRDDDLILDKGSLLGLLLSETYFSKRYRMSDRPTEY